MFHECIQRYVVTLFLIYKIGEPCLYV